MAKDWRDMMAALGLVPRSAVTVMTGAGVSAESGVPTFRGENGLWKSYRAQELATPEAFAANPSLVWEWYDWRRRIIAEKEPNPAHYAITDLENLFENFLLITQNVDGLHRRAGTRKLVELHGHIFSVRCVAEGKIFENTEVPLSAIPPMCECGAMLRPDVVWFGEALPERALRAALEASRGCDVMLAVGTSAVVQPAASMPLLAKQAGAFLMEINPDSTPISPYADVSLQGKAGEILPEVTDFIRTILPKKLKNRGQA
jgi:NAD-dependent deacetylase